MVWLNGNTRLFEQKQLYANTVDIRYDECEIVIIHEKKLISDLKTLGKLESEAAYTQGPMRSG